MRRRKAEKRQVIPDIRFYSEIVARLINVVMERGKKSTAQTIVYDAFDIIKQSNNDADPLEIFNTAMSPFFSLYLSHHFRLFHNMN